MLKIHFRTNRNAAKLCFRIHPILLMYLCCFSTLEFIPRAESIHMSIQPLNSLSVEQKSFRLFFRLENDLSILITASECITVLICQKREDIELTNVNESECYNIATNLNGKLTKFTRCYSTREYHFYLLI